MDAHALDAPLERNLPVLHGLTDIWNRNLLGHATHAVMTYDQRRCCRPPAAAGDGKPGQARAA